MILGYKIMIVLTEPNIHLTYCLNIHPGETWDEVFDSISKYTLKVRDNLAPDQPFGLGLRLSRQASDNLMDQNILDTFKTFLAENNLYVFTVNGFPYGDFHKVRVKKEVYQPDWMRIERVEYTNQLIHILSNIIPQGIYGSISTVPISYKSWMNTEADLIKVVDNLMLCVAQMVRIKKELGKDICIGLEPEPGCYLETTDETISFFKNGLLKYGKRAISELTGCTEKDAAEIILHHIGICFDTCHMSIQFENLSEKLRLFRKNNIRITKIQVSSALKTTFPKGAIEAIRAFIEPVYLHQVRTKGINNEDHYFEDLPEALKSFTGKIKEARIHFHVPLHFKGDNILCSTIDDLDDRFYKEVVKSGCSHLEVETYTFEVSPENIKKIGIVDSISNEISLVAEQLKIAK